MKKNNLKEIVLKREKHSFIDGGFFYCSKIYYENDLKSPIRDEKGNIIYCLENDKYIINSGSYEIYRDLEGKYKYYYLKNKDGRTNIEFHPLNFEDDSRGCLGFGINFNEERKYKKDDLIIYNSMATMNYLRDYILGGTKHGDLVGKIFIEDIQEKQEKQENINICNFLNKIKKIWKKK